MIEVLDLGIALFFYGNESLVKSNFSFQLLNSRFSAVDETKTVAEMYAAEHVRMLRLYVRTKTRDTDQNETVIPQRNRLSLLQKTPEVNWVRINRCLFRQL